MTLEQLHELKRWQLRHARQRPVEGVVCDLVLMAWVCGWLMLPSVMALQAWLLIPLSLLLVLAPEGYHRLRARMHQRGLLRCDWLDAVRPL